MNEKKLEQNIQHNVLERVRAGGVHAHSRAYFIIRLGGVIFVAVLAFIVSTFVTSFVFFSIHESGEQFLLGFGGRGIITFIELFPWTLVILDILILFLLEWLLKGFRIGYRLSLLTIFLAILISSVILGLLIDLTPFHADLLGLADRGDLPVAGSLYESVHDFYAEQGVFRGTITSRASSTIVIAHYDYDRDSDDGIWTVTLPASAPVEAVGNRVYVFGTLHNGVIKARDIGNFSTQ